MTPIALAVAVWRKLPARARKDAIHYFRDEVQRSDDWAKHELGMGRGDGDECRRHREDAKAMRAAVALLKAAEKPRKERRKR